MSGRSHKQKLGKKGLVHRAKHVEEQLDILNVYTSDHGLPNTHSALTWEETLPQETGLVLRGTEGTPPRQLHPET